MSNESLSTIASIVSALATLATAIVAWCAFANWRERLIKTAQCDVARKCLVQVNRISQCVRDARHPLSSNYEEIASIDWAVSNKLIKHKKYEEYSATEKDFCMFTKRFQSVVGEMLKLKDLESEATVVLSTDAHKKLEPIYNIVATMKINLSDWLEAKYEADLLKKTYFSTQAEYTVQIDDKTRHQYEKQMSEANKLIEQFRKIIYQQPDGRDELQDEMEIEFLRTRRFLESFLNLQ